MAGVRGMGRGREEVETCSALGLLVGSKEANLPLIAEVSTESSESPKGVPAKGRKEQGIKAYKRPVGARHRRPVSLTSSSAIVVTEIGFADPRHPARCPPASAQLQRSKVPAKGRFQLSGISFCQHCRARVSTEVGCVRTAKGMRVWVLRCVECLGVISKLS